MSRCTRWLWSSFVAGSLLLLPAVSRGDILSENFNELSPTALNAPSPVGAFSVTAGTVEESVLHLLQAKLNLFELVIGEIDMILGNLEEEREFEDVVADLWAESDDMDDFRRRMENLGDRLVQAKAEYLEQQAHDNKIFGDRFTPDQ